MRSASTPHNVKVLKWHSTWHKQEKDNLFMEYWNPNIERLPEEDLKQLQERKLRRLVENAFEYSYFYKKRFGSAGIAPNDIRSLEDLQKLPFTYKTDLRDTYPTGMFSVPQSQIVRFHVSSGTTGVPTVVGYTANDIDVWSTCLARSLTACGLGRGDVVQVAYGYGLFTGCLLYTSPSPRDGLLSRMPSSA